MCHNLDFGSPGLNSSVFQKLLNSYSYISFMKSIGLSVFCIKILLFFKNSIFSRILVNRVCSSTDRKCLKFLSLVRLILNWCLIN